MKSSSKKLRELGLGRGDIDELPGRVPDHVDRPGWAGSGREAQLDLLADLGLLFLGQKFLALIAHGPHGLVHGHGEVLLHDRRRNAARPGAG